jgi:Mg2+ and Co2+ transporter CorA
VLDCVKPILEAGEDDLTDVEWEDELYKLQEEYMKQEQDRIKEMLTQTNFYLEDYSNLAAALSGQSRIQGQDRIELVSFCVLYL